jgi:hypothetical protein
VCVCVCISVYVCLHWSNRNSLKSLLDTFDLVLLGELTGEVNQIVRQLIVVIEDGGDHEELEYREIVKHKSVG